MPSTTATSIRPISADEYSTEEILFDAQYSDVVDTDPLHRRRFSNRQRARETRKRDRETMDYLRHKISQLTDVLEAEKQKRQRRPMLDDLLSDNVVVENMLLKAQIQQNDVFLGSFTNHVTMPTCRVRTNQLKVVISLR
ncbi:Aste57867_10809 [Aphanomyces stellatus]|uniref:Aste57867_10809 protein n=1 Tax=Aphanomyces stellatus TaxID=120398 RepID=A0A485KRX3_9STRA|nr:hypothetical protein As57867_010769 [Aphanomyces stellatus]VFT87678.1 Aste57867_10809 [Aphanomyces stellatus]